MTDIYVRRPASRPSGIRRWLGSILILLLLVALFGVLRARRASKSDGTTPAPTAATPTPSPQAAGPEVEQPAPAAQQPASTAQKKAPPASLPSADPAFSLLEQARRLKEADDLLGARERCYEALAQTASATLQTEAEDLLNDLNTTLLFSPRPMPEKVDYVVVAGDSLDKIARSHNTSVELLARSHPSIRGALIRPGQRLRIFNARLTVVVDTAANMLTVYANDRYFKRYRVGTGQFGQTPKGTFQIINRIAQPPWTAPDGRIIPYGDTNNVLGTHWLSIDVPGYGIHGTWEPETIGHASSAGCVRLLNVDVEELYQLLPVGTPVTITE